MQSYVPQEPRSLFGVGAFALTVLTIATLVVGPALLAQRHAPLTALPEVARSVPAVREITIAPARMDVVLERAAYVRAVRTSGTPHRQGHRG
jgi:hypothetical protein